MLVHQLSYAICFHSLLQALGAYSRLFPCMEATYPYAKKWNVRNAAHRGLWVLWSVFYDIRKLAKQHYNFNQLEHSISTISTNESAPLWSGQSPSPPDKQQDCLFTGAMQAPVSEWAQGKTGMTTHQRLQTIKIYGSPDIILVCTIQECIHHFFRHDAKMITCKR